MSTRISDLPNLGEPTFTTVDNSTFRRIYDWARQIQVLPVPYTGDDLQMAKEAVFQARRCAEQIIKLVPQSALPFDKDL